MLFSLYVTLTFDLWLQRSKCTFAAKVYNSMMCRQDSLVFVSTAFVVVSLINVFFLLFLTKRVHKRYLYYLKVYVTTVHR